MNKKEINILKKAYKIEVDGKVKERLLMIRYSYEGKTSREVGEMLQCDHALVLFWKKRYAAQGVDGLHTRPKSGKPRQLSRRQEERIKAKVSVHDSAKPWTTKGIADLIRKETGVQYTQRHVQRILNQWGLTLLVPRPTFWQKASGEEMRRFWKKNPSRDDGEPYAHARLRRRIDLSVRFGDKKGLGSQGKQASKKGYWVAPESARLRLSNRR